MSSNPLSKIGLDVLLMSLGPGAPSFNLFKVMTFAKSVSLLKDGPFFNLLGL